MVVEAHFPNHETFVVLDIDESQVAGEVRSVTFRDEGRSETFQHVHGTFPVSAVLSVRPLADALAASA